jgi:mannose-6-phosphate isomerase-like protein (cupin superfamily)
MEPIFSTPEYHPKGWGEELWIVNNEKYCGKLLRFNKGAEFSMHYHIKKEETWFVLQGSLKIEYYDLSNADKKEKLLNVGDVIHICPCIPHKLFALTEASLIEVSTQHFEEDSYRVEKGNSQK